jgi:orotidine-5'-phosphate decarboxylase
MGPDFSDRLIAAIRAKRSPCVVGLDPRLEAMPRFLVDEAAAMPRDEAAYAILAGFGKAVVDAVTEHVPAVKLQSAFYELLGVPGLRALLETVRVARAAGLLVIVDAKRGDVGSTNDAYAEAFLGPDAPLGADALTVHPYLGLGAMGAFVDRANEAGSCLLVVTRSSNPEGRAMQSAVNAAGLTTEEQLLVDIGALNARLAPGAIGPIGAVVGPTHIDPALDLRSAQCVFLAPGVGAQGARPGDVARVFAACPDRVVPSASRSLLDPGPDIGRLRDTAADLALEFREILSA